MRKLRLAILIFFLIALGLFVTAFVKRRFLTDYTPPVINAELDELSVSITATDEDLLRGMTAYDNVDGDVTSRLVVVSKGKFIEKGVLHVNYAAFDSSRNVGTKTRTITYVDYTSPKFRLTAPLRYPVGSSNIDYLQYVTAEDCLEGDITSPLKISFGDMIPVSESASEQAIDLQVTNNCGDSAVLKLVARTEDYAQYSTPSPSLSDYIVYVPKGGRLDVRSLINGIWVAGSVRSFESTGYDPDRSITIDTTALDLKTPGVYRVRYQLFKNENDILGSAELIVIVED